MPALSKIHMNTLTEEDLKEYTLSDKRNLYIVTKRYPYHSRTPWYNKGEKLRVTRVIDGTIAEVALPDGEPMGVTIPMDHLKRIEEDFKLNKSNQLTESLYAKDLKTLVDDTMTIDEFKSKMGDDEDVIVVAFFIDGREPAGDLNNFIEKGYSFILDADVSPGEMDDGKYIVFVEFDRSKNFPKELAQILKDLQKLTTIKRWHFKYFKFNDKQEAIIDNLVRLPLSKRDYLSITQIENTEYHDSHDSHDVPEEALESIEPQLNAMRLIAGIPVGHHQPNLDPALESQLDAMRSIAGIPIGRNRSKTTDPELVAMQRIARIPGK